MWKNNVSGRKLKFAHHLQHTSLDRTWWRQHRATLLSKAEREKLVGDVGKMDGAKNLWNSGIGRKPVGGCSRMAVFICKRFSLRFTVMPHFALFYHNVLLN